MQQHSWLSQSSPDEHLSCFQDVVMTITMDAHVDTCTSPSKGCSRRSEVVQGGGGKGNGHLNFWKSLPNLSTEKYPFFLSVTARQGLFSYTSPVTGIINPSVYFLSISKWSSVFTFEMALVCISFFTVELLFSLLTGHLYFFFCDLTVNVFCPFFSWIAISHKKLPVKQTMITDIWS